MAQSSKPNIIDVHQHAFPTTIQGSSRRYRRQDFSNEWFSYSAMGSEIPFGWNG